MGDAVLVFFARGTHERLEVLTTAISDAVFHACNRHTWMLSMIGAIIFLHDTGVYKLVKPQILIYHGAKLPIIIGITITKVSV